MKFRPIFERMVIELQEVDKTKGGIFLPAATHVEMCKGKVIAKGEGAITSAGLLPIPVEVGETVLFDRDSVDEFMIDGEKIHTIKIHCVLGILG